MKKIAPVMFILCAAFLLKTGGACAEEAQIRIGISLAGKQIMGVYLERLENDTGIRLQSGYMIHAVCVSLSAVRYFTENENRPYAGVGIIRHIRNHRLDGDTLLSVPIGGDFKIANRQHISPELIPAFSFRPLSENPDRPSTVADYIFPLPSLSFKYTMD